MVAHPDLFRTHHIAMDIRHTQASFAVICGFFALLQHPGIDHRPPESFEFGIYVSHVTAVHNKNPAAIPDLRCSQTDPVRIVHGLEHVRYVF